MRAKELASIFLATAVTAGAFPKAGLCAAAAAVPAGQDQPLERALDAELSRASTDLKEPGYPPPYYVSLTAIDIDAAEGRCLMGARSFSGRYRQRLITPDVRVGDYTLDNHPVTMGNNFIAHSVARDDDEFALRHELWLMLDSSYKQASADFLRKQAVRVQRGKSDYDTDDLTREKPRVVESVPPGQPWDYGALDKLCVAASGVFRRTPSLLHGEADYRARRQWSRLRDSEHSRVDFGRDYVELELDAAAITSDGMRELAARHFVAPSPDRLPTPRQVEDEARGMAADLAALQLAKSTSPFSAPAVLDPSVAAAVVLSIGLRLSGEEQRNPSGAQTFRGRLGKPVMSPDFTLVDDPSREDFQGTPLAGSYAYDDQGVPAQRVTLIDKGVLTGALLSRYPIVGFSRSNGHGRAFPGYLPEGAPGSLFLTARKTLSRKRLLERLRRECRKRGKPYGLWVRRLRSFAQQQGTAGQGSIRLMPTLLYLVDAKTGALTLVRDLDMVGTPLVLLGNVAAAGDDAQARNLIYGVPMSVVTPSLLLTEVELQRSESKPEKPPILPPPPAPGADGEPARVSPPFIPRVPYVQAVRYVIRGGARGAEAVPESAQDGGLPAAAAVRRSTRGADLILDVKVAVDSLPQLGPALRRLDGEVARSAAGRSWSRQPLCDTMTRSAYRSFYGDGWPPERSKP